MFLAEGESNHSTGPDMCAIHKTECDSWLTVGAASGEGGQPKEEKERPLLSGHPKEKRRTSRPEFIAITEEMNNVPLTLLISQ